MKCVISRLSSYDDINLTKGKYYISYYTNRRGKYIGIFICEADNRRYTELLVLTTFNSPTDCIRCKILNTDSSKLERTQDLLFGDTVLELSADEVLLHLVAEGI